MFEKKEKKKKKKTEKRALVMFCQPTKVRLTRRRKKKSQLSHRLARKIFLCFPPFWRKKSHQKSSQVWIKWTKLLTSHTRGGVKGTP